MRRGVRRTLAPPRTGLALTMLALAAGLLVAVPETAPAARTPRARPRVPPAVAAPVSPARTPGRSTPKGATTARPPVPGEAADPQRGVAAATPARATPGPGKEGAGPLPAPALRPSPAGAAPVRRSDAGPRRFLLYLVGTPDPVVIDRYEIEQGEVVFPKYGGWVRVPTWEVARIVPDLTDPRDRTANLPPPPVLPETGGGPLRPEPDLFVTMRGGGSLRVSGFVSEGDHVRVVTPDGAFAVARGEILGVVRVPAGGAEPPEAWLSIQAGAEDGPSPRPAAGLVPRLPHPRLPAAASDRPHLLRLAHGGVMRVEAFWVEEGELRFRRSGGVVGVALAEVAGLIPEALPPARSRVPVRFARRLGPDLLEVHVRSGTHRVRLLGVAPTQGTWTAEDPWAQLERGSRVQLEFDRQRYDADGAWLAYVFLPNGRMLNAELIRVGLARPVRDGRALRYLDLLFELASADGREGAPAGEPAD